MADRKKFGEILLEMGAITENDLNNALSRQEVAKKPLGQIFEELGIIRDTDILRILSRQFNLNRIEDVHSLQVPEKVLELVDAQTALEYGIFAFDLDMGFFDFIARPYNLALLLARIRRALRFACSFQMA